MPHECVECGDVFDDGSDEVFEGCPSCGATKFFYVKEVSSEPSSSETTPSGSEASEPTSPSETLSAETQPAETKKPVAETQTGMGGDDDIVEADSEYERAFGGKLDDSGDEDTSDEISEVDGDDAGFRRARADEARRELMDQFETIRIVEPGSYELNLMNLYEEDEKIIALQEDGRYQVSLPSAFDD